MQLTSIVFWALTCSVAQVIALPNTTGNGRAPDSVDTSQKCPESWKEYGNSCYLFVTSRFQIRPMSWNDSRANCKRYGADLVSILDSLEADFIYRQTSVLQTETNFWIGLYQNRSTNDPKGGWAWSDGSNFTNPQQWKQGEPNDHLNISENCVAVFSIDMKWNGNSCSNSYFSICKRKKGLPDPTARISGTLPSNKAVRLAGGSFSSTGRVEVYYNGTWRTGCDDNWDIYNAGVVCRQLGFRYALDVYQIPRYGKGSGPNLLHHFYCLGYESSLFSCRRSGVGNHNCDHSKNVGVRCGDNGDVRLVGGLDNATGRVEVYYKGAWGTVCDDNWDITDARVVCRQLGFRYALDVYGSARYGQGTGPILLDDVDCLGNESSLFSCRHFGVRNHNCEHYEDAGVRCGNTGDVRLVGGLDNATGRVEVYYNGAWGTVCDDNWDITDARVVCRQLGFRYALDVYGSARYGQGTGPILLDDVDCLGNESSLFSCRHNGFRIHDCSHSKDASVQCDKNGAVRLVGGLDNARGRVEVYYDDTWGTVCDDNWDINDAHVVCRQLGFHVAADAYGSARYGQGTGLILLDDVDCLGNESSLLSCRHRGVGIHNCDHRKDASVLCRKNGDIRLVGGLDNATGRVEVYYNGTWGTVCDDFWDINDAHVVCRQLGFHDAVAAYRNATHGQGTGPILLDDVDCWGNEISLFSCRHSGVGIQNCDHHKDASVQCENTEDERSGNSEDNTGIIAGGITGGILFFILGVVIVLLVQRRILKNQHEISVREFHALHFTNNRWSRIRGKSRLKKPTPIPPEADSFLETADVPEMTLPYVVVLEDWEIAPDNLKLLDKKLGEGQFGIVRKGLLTTKKGDSEVVAVKTLKDSAKTSDHEDLKMELNVLKQANKIPHPNVVRFMGSCSIKGKLHLVTEFCSGGSLRKVLINSRVDYINMTSTLNHRELLKLAVDIANGMAHLSSQKLIHRDLAARNILIGDDNTAKVSDFGLARDIKGVGEYTRSDHNLLPLKWMALESLSHDQFTTASDVWGYGILLHEITTLGEEPYKNIPPHQVVALVGCGYRMPKPPQCSNALYEIMTRCWKAEPKERPTFAEIFEQLRNMLMDDEKSYINITQILDKGSPMSAIPESKNSSSTDDESVNVDLKKDVI